MSYTDGQIEELTHMELSFVDNNITEKQIETYFREQKRIFEETGKFNADNVRDLDLSIVYAIFMAETLVLNKLNIE